MQKPTRILRVLRHSGGRQALPFYGWARAGSLARLPTGAPPKRRRSCHRRCSACLVPIRMQPPGTARDEAARRIATELSRLVEDMPPPGTLVVAGGETLRGLCISLGARSLELEGRIVPGLPRSIMRGG